MLSVSNAAMTQLANSLQAAANEEEAGVCFRIVQKDELNLALTLSEPAPTDMTFDHEGGTVLAVPKDLHDFCDGKNLDVNDEGNLEIA